MTQRGCEVSLDSYRLANYSVQVPCYICDGDNVFDAELCRHCFAPMALAHQSTSQMVNPQTLAVLGSSGSGKTVYLGMLMDILSRQSEPLHAQVRGSFSVSLQQSTISSLSQGEFPTKTPSEPDRWNWVHCRVSSQYHRRPLEVIVPDMAGEAIVEEIEPPNTFPVVRSLLGKSSGVVILIDAIRSQADDHEQDHFTMKLLTFLSELDLQSQSGNSRREQLAKRPVALVFTKADQCDRCFDDPTAFAETHAAGMWRYCQERFAHVRAFASGVAGACAYRRGLGEERRRVPLRVEPRGIVAPFEWMISKIPVSKKK